MQYNEASNDVTEMTPPGSSEKLIIKIERAMETQDVKTDKINELAQTQMNL